MNTALWTKLGSCAAVLAFAARATAAEPKRTVLLDNEAVRIAELVFEPGDSETLHTHETPVVVFFVTAGTIEDVRADGKVQPITGKIGDFVYLPKGTTHFARNTSKERVVCRAVVTK